MPNLLSLNEPMDLARLLFWVFAIVGLSKFLFRSFWSDIWHNWVMGRGDRFQEMDRLRMEIQSQRALPQRPGDPLSAAPKLTLPEIAERRLQLKALERGTFWQRLDNYQRLCLFCHCLAAAFICTPFLKQISWDLPFTWGAYAALASFVASHTTFKMSKEGHGHKQEGTCPDCQARR
jgi:hypothetical protein